MSETVLKLSSGLSNDYTYIKVDDCNSSIDRVISEAIKTLNNIGNNLKAKQIEQLYESHQMYVSGQLIQKGVIINEMVNTVQMVGNIQVKVIDFTFMTSHTGGSVQQIENNSISIKELFKLDKIPLNENKMREHLKICTKKADLEITKLIYNANDTSIEEMFKNQFEIDNIKEDSDEPIEIIIETIRPNDTTKQNDIFEYLAKFYDKEIIYNEKKIDDLVYFIENTEETFLNFFNNNSDDFQFTISSNDWMDINLVIIFTNTELKEIIENKLENIQ